MLQRLQRTGVQLPCVGISRLHETFGQLSQLVPLKATGFLAFQERRSNAQNKVSCCEFDNLAQDFCILGICLCIRGPDSLFCTYSNAARWNACRRVEHHRASSRSSAHGLFFSSSCSLPSFSRRAIQSTFPVC